MKMIEKVARAICNAGRTGDLWDELTHNNSALRQGYFEEANAAIEALREPTEEMISGSETKEFCNNVWRDMIDAALKE